MSINPSNKLVYLYPNKNQDVNFCIDHLLTIINKQLNNDSIKVEYFNSTIPNKLFSLIQKNHFINEEQLMKSFNYNKVNNIIELITLLDNADTDQCFIVLEDLQLIINNTKLAYNDLNQSIMKLIKELKRKNGSKYIIDRYNNLFISNNCDEEIELEK